MIIAALIGSLVSLVLAVYSLITVLIVGQTAEATERRLRKLEQDLNG